MTGMAAVLAKGGYATHYAGKWDCGMATNQHTPRGRGYSTSLSYFHHANDYYTQQDGGSCNKHPMVDLWNLEDPATDGLFGSPAKAYANGANCSFDSQNPQNQVCVYEDALFEERVIKILGDHTDKDVPLFIFWASHIVHAPLQVPDEQLAKFSFIDDKNRRTYRAMVNWIDGSIGRVVQKTKDDGFYENLLIVLSSVSFILSATAVTLTKTSHIAGPTMVVRLVAVRQIFH
eukprot:m.138502 g.138502  ORF g.138502 m.138502 type:complete len:232 (+) comp14002_c0_seq2:573-1268(+)